MQKKTGQCACVTYRRHPSVREDAQRPVHVLQNDIARGVLRDQLCPQLLCQLEHARLVRAVDPGRPEVDLRVGERRAGAERLAAHTVAGLEYHAPLPGPCQLSRRGQPAEPGSDDGHIPDVAGLRRDSFSH